MNKDIIGILNYLRWTLFCFLLLSTLKFTLIDFKLDELRKEKLNLEIRIKRKELKALVE